LFNKKLKIYFDFDGVLANTSKAFLDIVYYMYKNDENFEFPRWDKVEKWNFSNVAPFVKLEDIKTIFNKQALFDNLSFYYDEDLFSTKDLFNILASSKEFDLHIATKGDENNLILKKEFILNNFSIPKKKIHLMQGLDMDKSEINMSNAIHIDDHQDNLYSSNAKYKILFSFNGNVTNFNIEAMNDKEILKAFSVEQLYELILKIKKNEEK